MKYLLPWFKTCLPAPNINNTWPYNGELPTYKQTCSNNYRDHRVDYMIDEIRNDMQKNGCDIDRITYKQTTSRYSS